MRPPPTTPTQVKRVEEQTVLAEKPLLGRNTLGGVSLMVFSLGTHAVGDEMSYHSFWFKRSITNNRDSAKASSLLHKENILNFHVLKGKNMCRKALHVVLKLELSPLSQTSFYVKTHLWCCVPMTRFLPLHPPGIVPASEPGTSYSQKPSPSLNHVLFCVIGHVFHF